jgi:hypothetical protein
MKNKKVAPPIGKSKAENAKSTKNSSGGFSFLKVVANLGAAAISGIIAMLLFQSVEGYDWLLNTMLANNLKTIEQYPNLTVPQKYEAKWGGEIGYTFRIKDATPDDAIILMPPKQNLIDAGLKGSVDLPHMTYFLYPRKVVFADDTLSAPLISQANYIVCVNGWGLDKFPTPISNPQPFMVLPLAK